jgi:hypothetical protein
MMSAGEIRSRSHSSAGYPASQLQRIYMAVEVQHVAHPRLYGAPAHGRPRPVVVPTQLPLDPDDLPLAAAQTDQERSLAEHLPAVPYVSVALAKPVSIEPRQERRPPLRVLAERILHRAS